MEKIVFKNNFNLGKKIIDNLAKKRKIFDNNKINLLNYFENYKIKKILIIFII